MMSTGINKDKTARLAGVAQVHMHPWSLSQISVAIRIVRIKAPQLGSRYLAGLLKSSDMTYRDSDPTQHTMTTFIFLYISRLY